MDKEYLYIEQENAETLALLIERSFFYNGREYAVLKDEQSGERYVMEVEKREEDGEEMEDFIPVDDAISERILAAIAMNEEE